MLFSVLMVQFGDGMIAFVLFEYQRSSFIPLLCWRKKAQTKTHVQVAAASLQARTAGIDMHCTLQRLYTVLHAQALVMTGDVVFCSLPMVLAALLPWDILSAGTLTL